MLSRTVSVFSERPGLFHISLNASQNPPSQQLEYRIKASKKIMRDFPDGFTKRACQNLLGAFYFYNKEYSKAIKTFKEVYSKDKFSLTATANLSFVYRRLKRSSLADEYQRKTKENEDFEQIALAMADQAFAFNFDCYLEKDQMERAKTPVRLFKECLCRLKTSDKHQEILEIKYWLGQIYHKMHSMCPRRKGLDEESKEYYKDGIEALLHVRDNAKHNVFLSGAWAFLGLFLSKPIARKQNNNAEGMENLEQEFIREKKLLEYLQDPEFCFREAMRYEMSYENGTIGKAPSTEVLVRYALFLKSKKRLKEALELLNKSLDIDKDDGNWFSRTCRASVRFSLFENSSDPKELEYAIDDWEISCKINATPRDMCDLAKAYHKLYNLCSDKSGSMAEEAEEYLLNASDRFLRAVQALGQERRPEIHRAQGRFLRDIGEDREAIECFKRAMEVDTANKETISFEHLFETLLKVYKQSHTDKENHSNTPGSMKWEEKQAKESDKIMHEMAYFYDVALRKYSDINKETQKFVENYKEEMASLSAYFKIIRSDESFSVHNKNVSEIIKAALTFNDDDFKENEWDDKVHKYEKLWEKKDEKRGLANLCPACKNPTSDKGIIRQFSVFPISPAKARSLRYDYDFYVIYSPLDRDWVCHVLLQKLEVSYGYKGAVSERDIMPGQSLIDGSVRLIQNCAKVVVILRDGFEDSPECMYECHLAMNRMHSEKWDHFLIPICRTVNGTLPMFRTISFLDGVDECDWNKLIRAIETRP